MRLVISKFVKEEWWMMNNKTYLRIYHRNYKSRIVVHFLFYIFSLVLLLGFSLCIRSQYNDIKKYANDGFTSERLITINSNYDEENIRFKNLVSSYNNANYSPLEIFVADKNKAVAFSIYPQSLLNPKTDELLRDDEVILSGAINIESDFATIESFNYDKRYKIKKTMYNETFNAAFLNDKEYSRLVQLENLVYGHFNNLNIYKVNLVNLKLIQGETIKMNKKFINENIKSDVDTDNMNEDQLIEKLNSMNINLYDAQGKLIVSKPNFEIIPYGTCINEKTKEEVSCTHIPKNLVENASTNSNYELLLFNNVFSANDATRILDSNGIEYQYDHLIINDTYRDNILWYIAIFILIIFAVYITFYLVLNEPYLKRDQYMMEHHIPSKIIIINHMIFSLFFFIGSLLFGNLLIYSFSNMFSVLNKLAYTLPFDYILMNIGLLIFAVIENSFIIRDLRGDKNEN